MKLLQTKPQVKNMNINYHDLYYTVFKIRDDNEIVKNNETYDDYIKYNDIAPDHYIGRKMIMQY